MAAVHCHLGNHTLYIMIQIIAKGFRVCRNLLRKIGWFGLKRTRHVDVKLFEISILHSFYPFSCELSGIARSCRDYR